MTFNMSSAKKRLMTEAEENVEELPIDYFSHLNDICLSHIFTYLSVKQRLRVALVCKRWRDAAALAWTDRKALDFSDLRWQGYRKRKRSQRHRCIATILRNCGDSLQELQLGTCANSDILQVVKDHCRNLKRLQIDMTHYTPGTKLVQSALESQRLEYIKIFQILPQFFVSLYTALPTKSLTEIHLVAGDYFPLKDTSVFQRFSKLTAITLEGFDWDRDSLIGIGHHNQLTHLSLRNGAFLIKGQTPDMLPLIQLTNLEHLNLSTFAYTDDDFIRGLSINCKKLRSLNLKLCYKVTDRGVQALADLPQLEELDLSHNHVVTDQHLGTLNHLQKLNVERCGAVHDPGIIQLVQSAVNLHYLNVAGTFVSENVLRAAADASNRRHTGLKVVANRSLNNLWKDDAGAYPLMIVDWNDQWEEYERSESEDSTSE